MVGGLNSRQETPQTVWLAFDEAWNFENLSSFKLPSRVDALAAGPSLRFISTKRAVESFYVEFGRHFRPFILSGSGDFHHLTAVFTRQIKEPFTILSFDNHPDWDIRPPHWSCGAWVNRALENPLVQQVAVWGCGSFECGFPWRLLGNRPACRSGRLRVSPWQSGKSFPSWLHPISPADWRLSFAQYVESIRCSNDLCHSWIWTALEKVMLSPTGRTADLRCPILSGRSPCCDKKCGLSEEIYAAPFPRCCTAQGSNRWPGDSIIPVNAP